MLNLTLIGGPTALLEYAGTRLLTDPTFSPPGPYPGGLVKTTGPAIPADQLDPIDAVLLSHDHHADNLDPAGRDILPKAGTVLTTVVAAERLGGNAVGLQPWEPATVGPVTVTAVPAVHGPPGSEPVTGPVIGFVLEAPNHPTVYVSGDNASLDVVDQIAKRLSPIPVAVLFAGAVQLPHRFDGAYLTLSADLAAQAATRLGVERVAVIHTDSWAHFSQGTAQTAAAFAGNGIGGRLVPVTAGETVSL